MKMISGYLRLVAMKTLSNKRLSGYELIKQIEKDTSGWKPSYGSIYPLLEKLLKENLVNYQIEGRRKIYYLTSEGRKQLPSIDKSHSKILGRMMAASKAFGRITDKKEIALMNEVYGKIRKGQVPFKELSHELSDLNVSLFDAYSNGKDKKKIKEILKTTIRRLKQIS